MRVLRAVFLAAGTVVVLIFLLVVGVGLVQHFSQPTEQEVVARHAAQFAALRDDLRGLAALLPPVGQIRVTSCAGPSPGGKPFVYDKADPRGNTIELVMLSDLAAPGNARRGEELVDSPLLNLIAGKNPDADDFADKRRVQVIDAMAEIRYVGVVRVSALRPGVATGSLVFTPGAMEVEAIIVALQPRAVVCTVLAKATNSGHLSYVTGRRDLDAAAQEKVDLDLRANAIQQLEGGLNALGQGTFTNLTWRPRRWHRAGRVRPGHRKTDRKWPRQTPGCTATRGRAKAAPTTRCRLYVPQYT
ncbi:hypothetical protein [Amycolatopsis sp. NPDC059021]|uniref:hypothetical protein n=1 Tax=Amycolatopsis sp. NPDC059021 TaxID=3346704 RepID=UPI00366BF9B6